MIIARTIARTMMITLAMTVFLAALQVVMFVLAVLRTTALARVVNF